MSSLEILAVKNIKEKNASHGKPLHPNLLKPPFLLCMSAPPKSGKSVVIMNLIYNLNFYHGAFENILWFSPTVANDKTTRIVMEDDKITKIHENLDLLDDLLDALVKVQKQKAEQGQAKHMLIIIDDCLGFIGKSLMNLCTRYRHNLISIIITGQAFRSLPRQIRVCAGGYIIFKTHNKKDLASMEEEFSGNFKNFLDLYNEATKRKHNFLFLDMEDIRAFHNFTDLLWSKDDDYED